MKFRQTLFTFVIALTAVTVCSNKDDTTLHQTKANEVAKQASKKATEAKDATGDLSNYFKIANHRIKQLERVCGRNDFILLDVDKLTSWNKNMSNLSGISYGGVS